ncbi:MAG: alpha/beta hydrolase family protein [Thermoguttaceae bacterium]|jgi:dienelactone hydrolase|nr:alpha/beta hydrolase family protein [Thermoguttaceae bacterium]
MTIPRRKFLAQSTAGALVMGGINAGKPAAADQLEESGFRTRLLECLGGPWPEPCELRPEVHETIERDGYRIESVSFQSEPEDRVPALLLVPEGVDAGHPAPAVAVWHQHNGEWHLGKSEPAGLAGNPMHHTGVALVREGYVVLCPDALCFEQRQDPSGTLKAGSFERFEFLRYVVAGKCMAWKNILDMRRAVDYLCSRPEVDRDRIGCYGHSMGSTHTWLVGPWEPRLKCLVGNCCLPTYAAIHRTRLLHCFPNFIPGLLQFGDTPDICGLIAPRALHLNFGEADGGSPIEEVREGVQRIAAAYEKAGAPEQFSYYIEPGAGHVLSEAMWRRAADCLRRNLAA